MFTRRLGSVVGTAILCVGLAAQGALSQESPSAEGVVTEPGQYIKFTRVTERITYVEHVDVALASVTWWGEMTIVTGR